MEDHRKSFTYLIRYKRFLHNIAIVTVGEHNMTTAYQQIVFALNQNLKSFEKSIASCDIHQMLDENVAFIETLKNANKTYESLPPNIRSTETGTHNKSKELVQKYFGVKSGIYEACSCVSASHRT